MLERIIISVFFCCGCIGLQMNNVCTAPAPPLLLALTSSWSAQDSEWLQMDGSLKSANLPRPDSRRSSEQQHAVTHLQMSSTTPLPARDKCQYVGMYRCWSLIVWGQASAHSNNLSPPSPRSRPHDFLWKAQAPLWGHRWPLTPEPLLHEADIHSHTVKSRVLTGCAQRHPPRDTLSNKGTLAENQPPAGQCAKTETAPTVMMT